MDEQKTGQDSNQPKQQIIFDLPGPINILGEAWLIYKSRIKTFLGIMVISFLATLAFVYKTKEISTMEPFSLQLTLFSLIVAFIQMFAQLALIYAIQDPQKVIGIKDSYKRALAKFIPFVWTSLLVAIIVLGGFILLIIPGIIFTLWFSFYGFIFVEEDLKGTKAIFKSKEYVQGRMGDIFLRFIFIVFLLLVIPIIFSFVLGKLASPIISFFASPLAMIYCFLVYKKTKELKSREISYQK
jgi:hypothetical protein